VVRCRERCDECLRYWSWDASLVLRLSCWFLAQMLSGNEKLKTRWRLFNGYVR
jgi:hypothetical protein